MPLSQDMIGRTGQDATDTVDDRWVMNYAAAVGDHARVYYDNRDHRVLPAHPAYVSHLEWDAIANLHRLLHELTENERLHGVHSYNHTVLHRAIHSGDRLSCAASVVGVERGRSGARLTVRTDTGVSDGPAATSFTSTVFRGVGLDGPETTPDTPKSAPDDTLGNEARHGTIRITPLAPYVFSECARDYGVIHTDISAAIRAGLPGLILHGTGTIAYALSDIVNHELGGDPTAVAGFQASLRATVMCPSENRIEARADPDHGVVWFELLTPDGAEAISHGAVFARPGH